MSAYELTFPERPQRSQYGRFCEGHIPWNKGKKWSEYMDDDTARKVKQIGLKNLVHSHIGHPGHHKKSVVGITKSGKFYVFPSMCEAANATGIERTNIKLCCQGKRPSAGGLRWFFENDDSWIVYRQNLLKEKYGIVVKPNIWKQEN